MKTGRWLLIPAIALGLYLLFWPTPVDPVAWDAPKDQGFTGAFEVNQGLANLELLDIDNDYGPEDLAIDSAGTIVVSMHSGALLKLQNDKLVPWVNTGGRPLGIEFNRQNELIVADAFLGLLKVSESGEVSVLTNQAADSPIDYADDLDIATDGKVYFSDASTRFGAKQNGGTFAASLLDIMEHSGSGRLLVYDPATGTTEVLLGGLNFANGVALNHDESAVLVNETGSYRVLRYWLTGDKAGKTDILIDNLPGFPDNLARVADGYWLGLASPRSSALDGLSAYPFLRKVVQRLPEMLRPQAQMYGHVVKISREGEVLSSLQDPSGAYPVTTGVLETPHYLYISSLTADKLARKPRH